MTETAGEIVKDALTELTVQAQDDDVPAIDMQTGLRYLNRMMQTLDANGVQFGYTLVSSSNDVLTVPAGCYEPMMYQLAKRLASGFDIAVNPELNQLAREGKKTLYKINAVTRMRKSNFPSTLPIGSGNDGASELYPAQRFFDGCCEDQDECEESS